MLINQNEIQEDSEFNFDLCIIGAGACGIAIARFFNNLKLNVALIESGGFEYSAEDHQLYSGETIGVDAGYLTRTRLRMFGGTTGHWGGLCRPLDDVDFKKRAWLSDSVGWPFSRETLVPYYDQAAAVVQIAPFFASGPERKEFLGEDSQLEALLFRYGPPTRFGSEYRKELIDSKNVSIFLKSNATELRLNDGKTAVRSLNVVRRDGGGYRVKAKHFILATGGLENPRFLLNSNRDIATGIGNQHDLVGRYFMSHAPSGGLGSVAFAGKNTGRVMDALFNPRISYVGIKEETQQKLQLLNHGFRLRKPSAESPEELRSFAHINDAFSKFYSGADGSAPLFVFSIAEQSPNRNSRVSLSRTEDFTGMKKLRLDFRTNDIDRSSVAASFDFLAAELGRLALGRVRIDFDDALSLPFRPDDHHMGTTRMHNDPKLGVVDENCKVHGTANLFIVGGSVFPSSGFANPTLTIVTLALRLADHIKGTYS